MTASTRDDRIGAHYFASCQGEPYRELQAYRVVQLLNNVSNPKGALGVFIAYLEREEEPTCLVVDYRNHRSQAAPRTDYLK